MHAFDLETLLVTQTTEDFAVVSLNRPTVANAINTRMGQELTHVFHTLSTAKAPPRAIVLAAEGDRHFCAGGDLKERNGMRDADFLHQHAIFERMLLAIVDCRVPVIGAVNGAAFGGGCELALACDFVYASETARFALTETSIGIMPGCGGTQHLPRAVGLRRAKELILTATSFSAQQAYEWGMVNHVCAPTAVRDEAIEAARRISLNAPWRCARPSAPWTWAAAWICARPSFSRPMPTTNWCRRRTGVRGSRPSTSGASRPSAVLELKD